MARQGKRIADRDGIRVIVKTPVAFPPASRGFYQAEEDVLYVPVYPFGNFYSYLDSPHVLLDVDRTGRLIFIQVLAPRRGWRVRPDLCVPEATLEADIRFRDFRARLPRTSILTNQDRSVVHIRFRAARNPEHYRVADHLVFDLTPDDALSGIWITAIEDDRAARGMAAWRKSVKKQFAKETYDSRVTRYDMKP